MKTIMQKMKKVKATLLVVPLMFALGACSQTQNEPGTNVTKGGKSSMTAKNTSGAKGGTVRGGVASNVSSNSRGGNRGGNRGTGNGNRGNYLPGGRVNNNGNDTSDITIAGLNDPNNLLSQRIIFFDYDKAAIRPEYMVLINTHAKLAAKYPQLRMRLEGHADERGSRGYNVALSEQRAQSVKRIMGTQGARSIRTIGYGEEKPLVKGHSKKSWQKNRRVEIKYDNY